MSDQRGVDVADLIADAYREASLAGADMPLMVEDLEALRRELKVADPIDARRAANSAIAARPPASAATTVLASLRDSAVEASAQATLRDLEGLASTDPAAAALRWLALLGEATTILWPELVERLGRWGVDHLPQEAELAQRAVLAAPLMHADRYADVRDFLRRLASDDRLPVPDRLHLTVILGQISLYYFNDLPEVRRMLAAAERLDASHPRLALFRATIASKRLDWASTDEEKAALFDEAARLIEQVAETRGVEPQLAAEALSEKADLHTKGEQLSVVGEAFRRTDVHGDALEALSSATEVTPWDASTWRSLACHQVRSGADPDDPEVARLMSLAKLLEPDESAAADNAFANACFDSGRVDAAMAAWDRALDVIPAYVGPRLGRVAVHQARGDLDAADAELRELEEAEPGLFEVAQGRAWLAEAEERWGDAVARYDEALDRRPEVEPQVRADIAWPLLQLGRDEEALAHAHAACALLLARGDLEGPAVSSATSRLLEVVDRLAAGGRLDDAVAELAVVKEVRGTSYDAEFWNKSGVLYHNAGQMEEALSRYLTAIDIDASVAQYHHNVALARLALGELDGAVAAAEDGHAIDGDDDAFDGFMMLVWNARGNLAYEAADYALASYYYRQAVDSRDDSPVVLANLAGSLQLGTSEQTAEADLPEAAELFRRADELSPGSYAEQATLADRMCEAVRAFGPHLATVPSFARCRVILAPDLVPMFADENNTIRSDVSRRLDEGSVGTGPFGMARPGVRFREEPGQLAGLAKIVLNGRVAQELFLTNDPEPLISAVEQLLLADPGGMIGPDDTVRLMDDSLDPELQRLTGDAEAVAALTRALRAAAADGRAFSAAVEQFRWAHTDAAVAP